MTRNEFKNTIAEKVFILNGTEEFGVLRSKDPTDAMSFEDAFASYREQVENFVSPGEESVITGEFVNIQDARAALIAVREVSDMPVLCFMDKCSNPLSALITLQALGADAFGCDHNSIETIKQLKEYATIPLIAKVDSGDDIVALVEAGANILVGECEYDQELAVKPPVAAGISALTSASKTVFIGPGQDFAVIGERINPTGKDALQGELKNGCMDLVREMALDQVARGATVLDINVGMPGIDEKETMVKVVKLLAEVIEQPLCIDSADAEVVEAALRVYPGRALVNSISAETPRIEKLLPVAAKYGAMIIALPMTDDGIPETLDARWDAVQQIADAAAVHGYQTQDICVDGLLLTACTSPTSGQVSLDTIRLADQAGYATVCGLSNISFGMPERPLMNSTFLAMAMGNGLSMAIANPSSEIIMNTVAAAEALNGQDPDTLRYIMKVTAT
jgi:5-methyltetrahydrofolate--homocysteine methyltransferase